MKKFNLIIDTRMYNASGIGVYIKNTLLHFNKNINISSFGHHVNSEAKNYKAKSNIYSIQEQIDFLKIPSTDFFWSPHWNIPLLPIRARKRIVTIHDVYHLVIADKFSWHRRLYAKFMINQAVKKSDIILTVSEFSKQEIIKYTKTKKNIYVVHNGIGVEPSIYPDSKGSLLNSPYILYVGNVKPHKNLTRALAAFEALPEEYNNYNLLIVGKKENFITGDNNFVKAALENNRVIFTGYVSDSELVGYYKFAEILFFPSLYEGFGLPPLEAQACGTPCLVSDAASLPEVCGNSVLYCKPTDVEDMSLKLKQLLSNKSLQKELIVKGFSNINRFNWKASALETIKIIEDNL